MYWSAQDVDDELSAALDLIKIGDVVPDNSAYHARARRHVARARVLSSVLVQCEQAREAAAAASSINQNPPSSPASGADESSGPQTATDVESAATKPPAFVGDDAKLVRALGGPYKDQTLVIYPGRTRWIVRDAGGSRSSVHATADTGPIDAIPAHLFPGLTVEGYYRADQLSGCAMWMPVAGMADRPSPKLA